MAYSGSVPYLARFDGNQTATEMGVLGTLGTSDTAGTALMMPFSLDPSTGAAYNIPLNTFIQGQYNTINVTYPAGTQEVYQYLNGAGTVGTVTVNYTDSTKGSVSQVIKTP